MTDTVTGLLMMQVVGADDNMTDSARGGGSSNSSRDREDTGMGFSSKSIRRAFIRKVSQQRHG